MALSLAPAAQALGLSLAAMAQGPAGGGAPGGGSGGARPQGPGPGTGGGPGASRGAPERRQAEPPHTGAEPRGARPPMGADRSTRPPGVPEGSGRTRDTGAPVFGGPGVDGGFPKRAPSATDPQSTSRGDGSADASGAKRAAADASYRFRGKAYVRSQDGWYETRGAQRVPVAPPVGLAVDALPPDHETRWIDGVPYFIAGDAYFVWRERERKYQIVEPPAGALAPGLPELLPPVLPSGERPLGP